MSRSLSDAPPQKPTPPGDGKGKESSRLAYAVAVPIIFMTVFDVFSILGRVITPNLGTGLPSERTFFLAVGAASALLTPFVLILLIKWAGEAEAEQRRKEEEKRRGEEERSKLTSRLDGIFESSTNLIGSLPAALGETSELLRRAEAEYQAYAYGPYWDAVEKAAERLNSFVADVERLATIRQQYERLGSSELLKEPKQTPRPFPTEIPSPGAQIEELQRILRLGQTCFFFAIIWEQRREAKNARKVLTSGFDTMEEAVKSLGKRYEQSRAKLQHPASVAPDAPGREAARLAIESRDAAASDTRGG